MEKLLILGGTNFIGRHLIDALLQQSNFDLTIFNRGLTNPGLYPKIKRITGDRRSVDIHKIGNENWDYIIDLSCYHPDSLSKILSLINPTLKRYIFISTCSVYDIETNRSVLRKEDSPILVCTDVEAADDTATTYGKRKAECERVVRSSGVRYSIFRPALVYGEYDPTDRFYYWLYQLKTQSELMIANKGEHLFSVTYVDDLVRAILKTLNAQLPSDVYNLTTLPKLSISELINTTSGLLEKSTKIHSADTNFLKKNTICEWTDLPLWLNCNYYTFDNSKALNTLDIKLTDFNTTVKKTIKYYEKLGWNEPIYGLSDVLKNKLIDKLKKAKGL